MPDDNDSARALRELEEVRRSILESTTDFIALIDEEGTLLQLNRTLDHISLEEALGTPIYDYLEPESHEVMRRCYEKVFATGEVGHYEAIHRTPSGERLYFATRVDPIRRDGKVTALVLSTVDVTERHRAEEERSRLIAELEERNRELERYTYTVSHDLKSPLLTIKGFLGFVERNAREGRFDQLEADIERIKSAANSMSRLLDELLELSRIGRVAAELADLDLGEAVREAVDLVSGQTGERGVEIEIGEDLPAVHADRTRIVQVLQNLLDNAVKFMGDQGEPRIEVDAREDGDRVVCTVRDNGAGIEARYLDRVFGLFDKLDPNSSGTGVGLALVKKVVEVHGGRIWVESDGPGKGSRFSFVLPRALKTK